MRNFVCGVLRGPRIFGFEPCGSLNRCRYWNDDLRDTAIWYARARRTHSPGAQGTFEIVGNPSFSGTGFAVLDRTAVIDGASYSIQTALGTCPLGFFCGSYPYVTDQWCNACWTRRLVDLPNFEPRSSPDHFQQLDALSIVPWQQHCHSVRLPGGSKRLSSYWRCSRTRTLNLGDVDPWFRRHWRHGAPSIIQTVVGFRTGSSGVAHRSLPV